MEDDPGHRLLIRKTLENAGHIKDIFEVENGREAIEYVYGEGVYSDRKTYPAPDLILLDLRMPEVDGFEVLNRLKSDPDKKAIPVIIFSTSAQVEEIAKGYQCGANAYVTKPLDFGDFKRKLEELKLFWTVTAEKSSKSKEIK